MKIGAMKLGKNYQVLDKAFGKEPVIMQLYKEPDHEDVFTITVFTKPSVTITGTSIDEVCEHFSANYPNCIISVADKYNRECIEKQVQVVIDFAIENDIGFEVPEIFEEVLNRNEGKVRFRNE